MDDGEDDGGIVTVSTRIAYENRWTRVREDVIRRPDGSPGLYGVVERNDFVVVVPVHDDGSVTLVEQHRYPIRRRVIELPMGMWEDRPEIGPDTVARGELEEETGLLASRMVRVGSMFQGAGYSNQRGHVFVATGLTAGRPRRERSEQDMTTLTVPGATLTAMIADGRIVDAITIAAWGLLRAQGLLEPGLPAAAQDSQGG